MAVAASQLVRFLVLGPVCLRNGTYRVWASTDRETLRGPPIEVPVEPERVQAQRDHQLRPERRPPELDAYALLRCRWSRASPPAISRDRLTGGRWSEV